MLSLRLILAAVAAGLVSSLTDWLFMGSDTLYRRYDRHPEIWRSSRQGETRAILWSSAFSLLSCFVFALACSWLHLHSLAATLTLAAAVWLVGSLPVLATHSLFLKLSPVITASHAVGWLAKFALAACAYVLLVG